MDSWTVELTAPGPDPTTSQLVPDNVYGQDPFEPSSDQSGYEPSGRWVSTPYFTTRTQYNFERAMHARLNANPSLGPDIEHFIRANPTVSAQTVAALAYSDFYAEDSAQLARLLEEDNAAKLAATETGFYQGVKAISRGSIVIMEDLWNNTPHMQWPRIGINMAQGQSFGDAWDQSTESTVARHLDMKRLDIQADYGTGLLPSIEMAPSTGGIYARVRELMKEGNFEGSLEEQLINAEQQAKYEKLLETGLNPYAMSVEAWESTTLYKTRNGETMGVPYSPGAFMTIHFTTPGTRAYEVFSGMFDAGARVILEPTDLLFDNIGDVVKSTQVGGDFMTFMGKGSKTMQEILFANGIEIVVSGIPVRTGLMDADGNRVFGWAKGKTAARQVEGVQDISIDPEQLRRTWEGRISEHVDEIGDRWIDPSSPYSKPYVDRNLSPSQVADQLSMKGGLDAEVKLTIEHELVHSEVQSKWFRTRETAEKGVRLADYEDATSKAPEEVQALSRRLSEEGLGQDQVDELVSQIDDITDAANDISLRIEQVKAELKEGVRDATHRQSLNDELSDLMGELTVQVENVAGASDTLDDLITQREGIHAQISSISEQHAVGLAWDNMMDGSWSGPAFYKQAKKAHGLSNVIRPFMKVKGVSEWLDTAHGARALRRLGRMTDFESIRRKLPWLDEKMVSRISQLDTSEAGRAEIARILVEAFNSPNLAGTKAVRTSKIYDIAAQGLDAFEMTTRFNGGQIAQATAFMGKQTRRARVSIGNNILSATDLKQTLDTINSVLSTAKVDPKQISMLQRRAVALQGTTAGIDEVANELQRLSVDAMQKQMKIDDLDVEGIRMLNDMWDEWRGFEVQSSAYWASNKGKPRNWLWANNRFKLLDELDQRDITAEAFMEAQFSVTTRVVPDIRMMRRAHSQRRRAWELLRRNIRTDKMGDWSPLGYQVNDVMKAGDWAFGVWRDMQLMRGGWMFRILGEEHIRFGAAGYASMFSNPIDYFITAFNRMDFSLLGDELTLDELIRIQEGLGTGQLRDWRYPIHTVQGANWRVVSLINEPKPYWSGMTQEYITTSQDQILSMLAAEGREAVGRFLDTAEGKDWMRRVATDAKKESSLGLVANHDELMQYLDLMELRIAQVTGGNGLWKDPTSGRWLDVNDVEITATSKMTRDQLKKEIASYSDFGDDALIGYKNAPSARLQARLDGLRGYRIEDLDELGHAAWVLEPGDPDLIRLLGTGELDDIKINKEMTHGQVRDLDAQIEAAYLNRGVQPPEHWAFPEGSLDAKDKNLYRKASDGFFHWMNSVPSKAFNRHPFFQQVFGEKLADMYFHGTPAFRKSLDDMIAKEPSLRNAFGVGARKYLRDRGIKKFPKAFEAAPSRLPDSVLDEMAAASMDDAYDQGFYDRIPLQNDPDGFITAALIEAMEQVGAHEGQGVKPKGLYTQRNDRIDREYTGYPGLIFQVTGHTGQRREPMEYVIHNYARNGGDLQPVLGLDSSAPLSEIMARFHEFDVQDQESIAKALGWRDVAQTGGFTDIPSRATGRWTTPGKYGDYVDIFRRDHFPIEVQRHFDEEGDVEQLFTITDERFPALDSIGDFHKTFNAVRARTRFKRDWNSLAELADSDAQKAFYGSIPDLSVPYSQITEVDADDMLRNVIAGGENPPQFVYPFSYYGQDVLLDYPVVPAQALYALPEDVATFLPTIQKNIALKMMDDNVRARFANDPDGFGHWWEGMVEHQGLNINDHPVPASWDEASREQKQIIFEQLRVEYKDPMDIYGEVLHFDEGRKLIEKELGFKLDDAQAKEFRDIWMRRPYLPDEIFLTDTPTMPVGRVRREIADGMNAEGMMLETQTQMGDGALLLDQFDPALPAGLRTPIPFRSAESDAYKTTFAGMGGGKGYQHGPEEYQRSWDRMLGTDNQKGVEARKLLQDELDHGSQKPVGPIPPNSRLYEEIRVGDTGEIVGYRIRDDVVRILSSDREPDLYVEMTSRADLAHKKLTEARQEINDLSPRKRKRKYGSENRQEAILNHPALADAIEEQNYQRLIDFQLDQEHLGKTLNEGNLLTGEVGEFGDLDFDRTQYKMEWFEQDPQMVGNLLDEFDNWGRTYVQREARYVEVHKQNDAVRQGYEASEGRLQEGFNFGDYRVPDDPDFKLKTNFDDVPQDERNAAMARLRGKETETGQSYDWSETGGISQNPNTQPDDLQTLELAMQAAKGEAIDQTKNLFYDLSSKSNAADALKFIFPFADAWYEVLSRWGGIMNPVRSGGQSLRNVRRAQVGANAAKTSGFISTNEYGEEVFNMPIAPGSMMNMFIPDEANLSVTAKIPINSLMFIDPSVRGVVLPGVSPLVQIGAAITAPAVDAIPIFKQLRDQLEKGSDFFVYGDKSQYQPGDPQDLGEALGYFTPTTFKRIVAMAFDETHRDTYGNTKFRLFQALGAIGDPKFNLSTTEGARHSWDVANTAGTWLGWLRIVDAWTMPGQPQYFAEYNTKTPPDIPEGQLTYEEALEDIGQNPELRQPVLSILRAAEEYRLAREWFSEAEADLYMMERYGFVPAFLQSATQGLQQVPVTWGGVEWVDSNPWLLEAAPHTYAATVPPDADDTFSSSAWNNLYGDILQVEGVDNQPVRVQRSPSELVQAVHRSLGYDQLRFQQSAYDKALVQLRARYGKSYASNESYRASKIQLDRLLRKAKTQIQVEFPIVSGSNQGKVVGARQGITNQTKVDEIIDIGTKGTDANKLFRDNVPKLADVAEAYSEVLTMLRQLSTMMANGTGSPDWWTNSTSDEGNVLRAMTSEILNQMYESISDPHAKEYADWISENLFDPYMDDWEWVNGRFAPELARFPTAEFTDTIGVNP